MAANAAAANAAGLSSPCVQRVASGGSSVLVSTPRVVRYFSASAAAVAKAASAATSAATAAAAGSPSALRRGRSGGSTGTGRRRAVRVEENKELLAVNSPDEEIQLSEMLPPAGDGRGKLDEPGEHV
eukprot:scaffold5589_cov115-Isochrysis_galbana.AAC.6